MATENKYDRQLRLWGPSGQKRLAEARVLVLGAGPVATEALKNILLPGCCSTYLGGFTTIVDNRIVEPADLGNNFFVTADAVGNQLASTVAVNLRELNSECDVRVDLRPPQTAATDHKMILEHTLVISTAPLPRSVAVELDRVCRENRIPCIFARCYGLLGEVRVSYKEHLVSNSKSMLVRNHLHILNPFEELQSYLVGLDLEAVSWATLVKLPSLVLCAKAVHTLKGQLGGKRPTSRDVVAHLTDVFKRRAEQHNSQIAQAYEVSRRSHYCARIFLCWLTQ